MKNLTATERFVLDCYKAQIKKRGGDARIEETTDPFIVDGVRDTPVVKITFLQHGGSAADYTIAKTDNGFKLVMHHGCYKVYETNYNTGLAFVLCHVDTEGMAWVRGETEFEG